MSAIGTAARKALYHAKQGDRHSIDHARLAEALTDEEEARDTLRRRFALMSDEEWQRTLRLLSSPIASIPTYTEDAGQ